MPKCAEGLKCFQRSPYDTVPGCLGAEQDWSKTDYCVVDDTSNAIAAPTQASSTPVPTIASTKSPTFGPTLTPYLRSFGGSPPEEIFPLGLCAGDCDTDFQVRVFDSFCMVIGLGLSWCRLVTTASANFTIYSAKTALFAFREDQARRFQGVWAEIRTAAVLIIVLLTRMVLLRNMIQREEIGTQLTICCSPSYQSIRYQQ